MTSRERVIAAIQRKTPDRVPVFDQPWPETIERWRREGLPEGQDVGDYFDFDIVQMTADLSPRFPPAVLEETADHIVERSPYGIVWRRLKGSPSTPQFLDHPVKRREDWTALKERLASARDRVDWPEAWRLYNRAREQGKYVAFVGFAGNSTLEGLLGMERSLSLMLEDPAWYREMVETVSLLLERTVEMLHGEGLRFDAVWLPNDMGYRNVTTFSPATYDALLAPSDTQRNACFHRLGMQTILHSDGCIVSLIPSIIEAGFDCLQPLEVKAGMDVRELKTAYGNRIALFGGIDARLMADPDPARIEDEIRSKFAEAKRGGGYLYHSDHSVPPNVSFEQFRHVIHCVRKYGAYEQSGQTGVSSMSGCRALL